MSATPKPNNFKDQNCESRSSNCVSWDGPDITYAYEDVTYTVCKGEWVTHAMYGLLQRISALEEIMNIDNYNVTCLLSSGGTRIQTFVQMINALIAKSCS